MSDCRNFSLAQDASCGLYVHVPFCETKCGYCDFFSVAVKGRDTAPLVDRIKRELRLRLSDRPVPVRTIFCGGGTPTILLVNQLAGLLNASADVVAVDEVTEYTVEANPATVDAEKTELLVSKGVTRVSMGAQSFFPEELTTLERIHSPDDIAPSVATLRRAGVLQINLDLIFGIPGQTLDTWSQSLSRAIELEPDHIACYGLMYEPGTVLTAMRRAGKIKPCDENLEADMYECMVSTFIVAGYEQYETSNFAKPGCRSEHNLIYWRNQPYVGVGPSAVGCLDDRRYKNVADVAGYIRTMDEHGNAEAESETIDTEKLITGMVMMQLRLVEGLSIESFRRRTGMDPVALFGSTLDDLKRREVLTVSDTHIALTQDGRLVSDAVMRELVSSVDLRDAGLARPLRHG